MRRDREPAPLLEVVSGQQDGQTAADFAGAGDQPREARPECRGSRPTGWLARGKRARRRGRARMGRAGADSRVGGRWATAVGPCRADRSVGENRTCRTARRSTPRPNGGRRPRARGGGISRFPAGRVSEAVDERLSWNYGRWLTRRAPAGLSAESKAGRRRRRCRAVGWDRVGQNCRPWVDLPPRFRAEQSKTPSRPRPRSRGLSTPRRALEISFRFLLEGWSFGLRSWRALRAVHKWAAVSFVRGDDGDRTREM